MLKKHNTASEQNDFVYVTDFLSPIQREPDLKHSSIKMSGLSKRQLSIFSALLTIPDYVPCFMCILR